MLLQDFSSGRFPAPPAASGEAGGAGAGPSLCRVAGAIAGAVLSVGPEEIGAPSRGKAGVARARHVAMYLAHVSFQLTLSEVASGFNRDRTSVAYGVRRIEDERDDPAFEAQLARMEALAQSVREAGAGKGAAGEEAGGGC